MGIAQLSVDDQNLDNGSWRRIVHFPSIVRSDDGSIEKMAVEFIVMGDTADEVDTRVQSTIEDFTIRNPRAKLWFDDDKATPTYDWFPGDGTHIEMMSIVSVVPEEARTQKAAQFVLVVTSSTEVPESTGGVVSDLGDKPEGLSGSIEVVKTFFDSERYTLAASGRFVSTLNESAEGPYAIESVSDTGGKATFNLESPSVITADIDNGMFVDISSPSEYEGRHFVTAFANGNASVVTDTSFGSSEADVGATLLLGTTDTAEDNFQSAKSQILENLLETGSNGTPNSESPHMVKSSEIVSFSSEKKNALEFVLGSSPSALVSGQGSERGLVYNIRFEEHDMWNAGLVQPTVGMVAEGKCSITEDARESGNLRALWKSIEETVISQMEAINGEEFGGGLRHVKSAYFVDYATNDIRFNIGCTGRYNGTLSYSASHAFAEQKQRTAWLDTDGFDHLQEPKGPNRKMAMITVSWVGDEGGAPPTPTPPSESGFTYVFDSSNVVREEQLESESGSRYMRVEMEFQFQRFRLRGGGSGDSIGDALFGALADAEGGRSWSGGWTGAAQGGTHTGQF